MMGTSEHGFPDGARATPVPDLFFSRDLASIADPLALRALLWLLWRVNRRPSRAPAAVRLADAAADETLGAAAAALGIGDADRPAAIGAAFDALIAAGRVLALTVPDAGEPDGAGVTWLLVNDRTGRAELAALGADRSWLPDLAPAAPAAVVPADDAAAAPGLAEVVALYEANIGLVTPMLAEELTETASTYPLSWVAEAIREAVTHNARRWSYAKAILERWAREGRPEGGDEGDRRGAGGSRQRDSEGPYADWIRR